MATPSLILGNGNWAVKSDSLLGYALPQGKYVPREFTVTRATTATRTNPQGLVEVVPYNLLQRSQDFNNSPWDRNTLTYNSLVPAPNGTLTASNYSTAGNFSYALQVSAIIPNAYYTTSVYLKYTSGVGSMPVRFTDAASANFISVTVNLINGTISAISYQGNGANGIASIQNAGDGWYRVIVSGTLNVASAGLIFTNATLGATTFSTWGAQLVEGTDPLTYLPTTTRLNIPRVDYSLGSANLLLEPQRTNLVLQSEQFDLTTPWTTNISGTGVAPTRTANAVISPSGIQNADTIVFNRGAGNTSSDFSLLSQGITVATTGTYYFSVWMKATTSGDVGKQVLIRCGNAGTLQAFTLTANWTRYQTTATVTSGSVNSFQIGNRGSFTADNSVSVDLWGAQVELGAYATSYIPTTAASVTRNADSISRSNIFTNGYITSAGGTWFVEFRNNVAIPRDFSSASLFIGDSSAGVTNSFSISGQGSAARFRVNKYVAGVLTTLFTTTTDTCKIAIKWNGSTADVFQNGVKVVNATAFTAIALEFLSQLAAEAPKYINQMALYTTPLSDSELISLTTL